MAVRQAEMSCWGSRVEGDISTIGGEEGAADSDFMTDGLCSS